LQGAADNVPEQGHPLQRVGPSGRGLGVDPVQRRLAEEGRPAA
jgi:hypothetical protein